KEQEAARAIALSIAQHGDHDLPISQAVNGMGRCQTGLLLDLLRFNDLVQLRRTLVSGINNVNTARVKTRNDQELARFALVAMTRTTGSPAKVMQFITNIRHRSAMNDLGIGGRVWINIHRRQVSRRFDARS